MDKEWVETILKKFEGSKNISRVVSYAREAASPAGDNFTSSLERWNVKVVLGSGRFKTKKYIVKILPKSPVARKYVLSYHLVQKEINVYEKIFTNMEAIMDERDDKKDKLWCDLIGYHPYDMIILQDLTELNYVVPKRTDFMDMEHAILTMKALARFHALSKIIIFENLVDKNICGPYQLVFDPRSVQVFIEGGILGLYRAMENSWGNEWTDVAKRVKKAASETEKRLLELVLSPNDSCNVFNHGDLWLCNLMFKYHDFKNEPIGIKFIDFQLTTYNSFGWDLSFLLYTSVLPEFRRKNSKVLFDAYFDTIISTLDYYHYGGEYLTRDRIDSEMKRLEFVGFFSLATMYALTLAQVDVPFNLDVFDSELDPKDGFKKEIFESEIYKNTVQEDLRIFYEQNVI